MPSVPQMAIDLLTCQACETSYYLGQAYDLCSLDILLRYCRYVSWLSIDRGFDQHIKLRPLILPSGHSALRCGNLMNLWLTIINARTKDFVLMEVIWTIECLSDCLLVMLHVLALTLSNSAWPCRVWILCFDFWMFPCAWSQFYDFNDLYILLGYFVRVPISCIVLLFLSLGAEAFIRGSMVCLVRMLLGRNRRLFCYSG